MNLPFIELNDVCLIIIGVIGENSKCIQWRVMGGGWWVMGYGLGNLSAILVGNYFLTKKLHIFVSFRDYNFLTIGVLLRIDMLRSTIGALYKSTGGGFENLSRRVDKIGI